MHFAGKCARPISNGTANQAYLASIRDVTEKKHLAEQLLQSQKMEAMGLLAGGVAHDLNNLLTVIVNCATFLTDAIPEGDAKRNDVDQILGAVDRAEALVSQLLELTRKKPAQARIIDLGETATEMKKLLRRTLPADIELVVEAAPSLWPVFADRGRLEQVLMNLAVNAKDAMQEGGRITIALANKPIEKATEVRAAGDYVSLTVSDTGSGIKPETLPRIFEPFFTTKAPGQKPGPRPCDFVIRSSVKRAAANITVESKLGAGTTFEILLPRAQGSMSGAIGKGRREDRVARHTKRFCLSMMILPSQRRSFPCCERKAIPSCRQETVRRLCRSCRAIPSRSTWC